MIRMFIQLDREKIEREGIYDFEKMQKHIDDRIVRQGGYKDTDGWYTNGTWEGFGAISMNLERSDWFMDNVKTWLWNNTDYEDGPDDKCISDLLEEIREEKEKNLVIH